MQVRNSQYEKSLLNKIARAYGALEREVETELKVSYKLTFSQFRVLDGLASLGEGSQKEVALRLGVTPAVVTRQAEVLVARGLVELAPKNKRENTLVLTPKGIGAVTDITQSLAEVQQRFLSGLSVKDEVAFERAIESLSGRESPAP